MNSSDKPLAELPDEELDICIDGNIDDEASLHDKVEVKPDIEDKNLITCLKVKADPKDISGEDRKKNVKKLAGAISHSLRANGEINVRCFGNAAIGKAVKAIAIARNYIKANISVNDKKLQLECAPAFVMTDIGDKKLTGISFFVFATEIDSDADLNVEEIANPLMVKSDAYDIDAQQRKDSLHKLAGAISHSLEDKKEVVIRCFGNATIGKSAKALAVARGYTATRGPDLYCWPAFIVATINGNERTGIAWYAYTNES